MAKKSILVLGGGIGGVVVSSLLRGKLKDRITLQLAERKNTFDFPPSYPWLMLGQRRPEQVQKSLDLLRRKRKIDILNDEVVSIDPEGRSVQLKNAGTLPFDYLVISMGAEYSPNAMPGFLAHAHHIYDLDSAIKFRDSVEKFTGGTIAIGVARLPFKCPAAPYEVALLLDGYFRKKGIREKVKFNFFTPEGIPVPAVGPAIGNQVLELLRSRGIVYHPRLELREIAPNMVDFETGENIPYDLLFCVPPHVAPKPVAEAGLVDETGWVPVDSRTLETKYKGIYAIGDVASVQTPNGYTPYLPKAGVFAHGQAEVVAHNLAAEISNNGKSKEWDGGGACFLEVGNGQSAYVKGTFLAQHSSLAQPSKPKITFHMPSRVWHAEKVAFEKYWMHHWF